MVAWSHELEEDGLLARDIADISIVMFRKNGSEVIDEFGCRARQLVLVGLAGLGFDVTKRDEVKTVGSGGP